MDAPSYDFYTTDYIEALPEGERAELIDGTIYDMSAPNTVHQRLVSKLTTRFNLYFESKGGKCEVFPAPFAVYLNHDDRTYVEPDISVICDRDKINEKGCVGAPDLIVEVASEGSLSVDYKIKLFKYRSAGVREYWIVNPMTQTVNTYMFDEELRAQEGNFNFDTELHFGLYPELAVRLADMI